MYNSTVGAVNGNTDNEAFLTKDALLAQFPSLADSPEFVVSGGLWATGYNGQGQLGILPVGNISSPTQIGSLTDWKTLGTMRQKAGWGAIKTDGTLWVCGYNGHGSLGLGNNTLRSSPTQVGTDTNWKTISLSSSGFAGLKTDGTVWTCGYNGQGQLGLGDNTLRSSPVQVGTNTDWKSALAAHGTLWLMKTDGSIWVCGYNNGGQYGITSVNRSSPIQVGSLTNWKKISALSTSTLALKTDGTIWGWGTNGYGQLGSNSITNFNSPVQIGTDTNWKDIDYGGGTTLAIKTNGTLWGWGENLSGNLGLTDRINRSSPVQIGSLTNWSKIAACGYSFVAAIKTDGTLWAWGGNVYGELGNNSLTKYSSPVQVGSLTDWKMVSGSNNQLYGLRG